MMREGIGSDCTIHTCTDAIVYIIILEQRRKGI